MMGRSITSSLLVYAICDQGSVLQSTGARMRILKPLISLWRGVAWHGKARQGRPPPPDMVCTIKRSVRMSRDRLRPEEGHRFLAPIHPGMLARLGIRGVAASPSGQLSTEDRERRRGVLFVRLARSPCPVSLWESLAHWLPLSLCARPPSLSFESSPPSVSFACSSDPALTLTIHARKAFAEWVQCRAAVVFVRAPTTTRRTVVGDLDGTNALLTSHSPPRTHASPAARTSLPPRTPYIPHSPPPSRIQPRCGVRAAAARERERSCSGSSPVPRK